MKSEIPLSPITKARRRIRIAGIMIRARNLRKSYADPRRRSGQPDAPHAHTHLERPALALAQQDCALLGDRVSAGLWLVLWRDHQQKFRVSRDEHRLRRRG